MIFSSFNGVKICLNFFLFGLFVSLLLVDQRSRERCQHIWDRTSVLHNKITFFSSSTFCSKASFVSIWSRENRLLDETPDFTCKIPADALNLASIQLYVQYTAIEVHCGKSRCRVLVKIKKTILLCATYYNM